jgi:hypothetical protein
MSHVSGRSFEEVARSESSASFLDNFVREIEWVDRLQEQLRAIIVVYNLTHSVTDLETLTDQELIAWIVGAVRDQLAA